MRALMALLLLATVAAAPGCSSKNAPAAAAYDAASPGASGWKTAPAVTGSRLRARLITGGGSRELAGFHDSERNEDCTFQPAEGGRRRCLPEAVKTIQSGLYSDPACQIPLASVPACSTEAKYAISYRYDEGSCGETAAEIRSVLGRASTIYAPGPGGCAPQPSSSTSAPLFAVGDVVAWTAFV